MPKENRSSLGRRGDLRLTVPNATMQRLREIAEREKRDIWQQALYYIERGIEAEKAA